MKKLIVYVHGRGGSAAEAERYRALFDECEVRGVEYRARTPWEAGPELAERFDALAAGRDSFSVLANSIGAFFTLYARPATPISKAALISPVVDMERLILNMLARSGHTEAELMERGEIPTDFGETLSWAYLRYVREHPPATSAPTHILYGGRDALTPRAAIEAFAARTGAALIVMEEGEHWFHTEAQLAFLDKWARRCLP